MNSWFNNISFSWKLRIPLAVIGAMTLIIVLLAYSRVSEFKDQAKLVVDNYLPATEFLLEADRDLYQAVLAVRMLVLAEPGTLNKAALQETVTENLEQAKTRVGKYAELMAEPDLQRLVDRFNSLYASHLGGVNRVMSMLGNDRQAAISLSLNEVGSQFDAMREVIDTLAERTHEYTIAMRSDIDRQSRQISILLTSLFFTAMVVIGVIWLILPSFTSNRLKVLLDRLRDMARGERDLSQRLDITGDDEFGEIATEFNTFVGSLHQNVIDIVTVAQELSQRSGSIENESARTSRTLDQQRQEIAMAAAAINEMGATISEVASNTAGAAEKAKEAETYATEGQDVVGGMVLGIRGLATEIESSAAAIQKLKEDTDSVGTVLDVIRGIAEQTNLLALNAAIEAARAGEQGRGFAVVADEVRTLAQRTQESTQEIREVIEQLQNGADQAVDEMSASQSKVSSSVDFAQRTGSALDKITDAVRGIVDLNVQIATAAEEQSTATEEVNRNMSNITQQTEETAESAAVSAESAGVIHQLAQSLTDTLARFRV